MSLTSIGQKQMSNSSYIKINHLTLYDSKVKYTKGQHFDFPLYSKTWVGVGWTHFLHYLCSSNKVAYVFRKTKEWVLFSPHFLTSAL